MIYYVIRAYSDTKVIAAVKSVDALPRENDTVHIDGGEHAGEYRVGRTVHIVEGPNHIPDVFVMLDTFVNDDTTEQRYDRLTTAATTWLMSGAWRP